MAGEGDHKMFHTNFCDGNEEKMLWMNHPQSVGAHGEAGTDTKPSPGGFLFHMDAQTDFWQKTYYNFGSKDDGHVLYLDSSESHMVMETAFDLTAVNKFDQAGLMIRYDDQHWIKAGLESVDGTCFLSCVVTNNFSDWSTQPWPSDQLSIRLYRLGNDVVVETKSPLEDRWDFCRICHLDIPADASVKVGVTACSPTAAGGCVRFHHFTLRKTAGYHHTA